jgi:ABC-type transporter Mla subunit MlaD
MRRAGPLQSLASSPMLVGTMTVLIVLVAIFLSYNANQGLPFVPVYRVSLDVPNASRLTRANEVRIGGHRVGVVESIETVPESEAGEEATGTAGTEGGTIARVNMKLDQASSPLPRDSIFRVRYLSTFGLKYVEVVRGTGPPAPEGYVFNGTDDEGTCKLPVNLETYGRDAPAAARDGCFQPQAEFDDLANALDRPAREDLQTVARELGGAVAGRGDSVNQAIEATPPLMRELGPLARTLADATAQVASVADANAQLFTNAAVAFEALSRDPGALQEAISGAVPLLERGTPQLRRQRALLADLAVLERRLLPGARQLPVAVPIVNRAIDIGNPVLADLPATARRLRGVFVELRNLVEDPSTRVSLVRLRETFNQTLPAAAFIAPAQTVCNYFNYFTTFLPEHLSERSNIGFTQRNVFSMPYPPDLGSVDIGGITFDTTPGFALAPINGYTGIPANGLAGPLPNPAEIGLFDPHRLPIGHGPINAPAGQLSDEYPDCAAGQFGYPLGSLPLPGQPPEHPGIAVGDYPGSLGPTTLFLNRDGTRELRDTRVASRAPTTWGARP